MTSRERVKRALTFKTVDKVPVSMFFEELKKNYESDVAIPYYKYGKGVSKGTVNQKGKWTDIWGCDWYAAEEGVCGEVKSSPLRDWSGLDHFKAPYEVLKEADLSLVNKQCEESDKFMMTFWETAPNIFERMQHLRGTEQLMMDLAYGDARLYKLRDIIHEYFIKQMEMWVKTDVDAVHLVDDWGTQVSLLISPKMWREFFKPLYKEYCDIAHSKGKLVVMHSDGFIKDIIPDLAEIGVNAVNSQLFCMNIEELADEFHDKMAFWGEIDRQYLLPFGSQEEVRAGVDRVANAFFKYNKTGIVGECHWGKDMKPENIRAVYDQWTKY